MAATSAHGDRRPPLQGIRRSVTTPARSMSHHEQASLDTSDANAEILYEHPAARVIEFSPSAGSINTSTKAELPQDTDYPVDTIETLPWRSRGENLLAAGHMVIEKVRGSTNFLKCQNVGHAILRNSQCWCVDGESKFVIRKAQFRYWRIELPSTSDEEKAKVKEFIQILPKVLRYERTPCPFIRAFSVDLPEDAITPRRKGTWKRRDSSQPGTPDVESPKTNAALSAKRWALRSPPTAYPKNAPGYVGTGPTSRPGSSMGGGRRSSFSDGFSSETLRITTSGEVENGDGAQHSEARMDRESDSDDSREQSEIASSTRGRPVLPRQPSSSTPVSQRVASIERSGNHAAVLPASDARKRHVSVEARRVWQDQPQWTGSDYHERAFTQSHQSQSFEAPNEQRSADFPIDSQAHAASAREESSTIHHVSSPTSSGEAAPMENTGIHVNGSAHDEDGPREEAVISFVQMPASFKDVSTSEQDPDTGLEATGGNGDRHSEAAHDVEGVNTKRNNAENTQDLVSKVIESEPAHEDNVLPTEPLDAPQLASSTDDATPVNGDLRDEESMHPEAVLIEGPEEVAEDVANSNEHEQQVVNVLQASYEIEPEIESNLQHSDDTLETPIARSLNQGLLELKIASETLDLNEDIQDASEGVEQEDDASVVSDADSFHTLTSTMTRSYSDHDLDQLQTPRALEFDLSARPLMVHRREMSEMTITSSRPDEILADASSTSSQTHDLRPSDSIDQSPSQVMGTHSVRSQELDTGLRQRLRSRRSFSPMPPPSTIITNANTQENQARRITKIVLQQAIVKPVEVAVLLVHILMRIAGGATVSDLLSGDLFRRPEHHRRVSGSADQLNQVNGDDEHEDDYGVPIRGRQTRELSTGGMRGRTLGTTDEDAQSFVSVD